MSTPPITPPPQASAPDATQNADTGMDKFKSFVNALTGGGAPALKQQVEEHHARQLAEIDQHQQNLKSTAGLIAQARITKKNPQTGEPLKLDAQGNVNPTDPYFQDLNHKYDITKDAYGKLAGRNKNAKGIVQKMTGVLDHLTGRAQQGQSPVAGGTTPPPQASGSIPQPAGSQAASTPPPSAMQESLGIPTQMAMAGQQNDLEQKMAALRAGATVKGEEAVAGPSQQVEGLVKAGVPREKAVEIVSSKAAGPAGRQRGLHPVQITDPNDSTRRIPALQDLNTGRVYTPGGEEVDNPFIVQSGMLPTDKTSTSDYDAASGRTTTRSTSQKGGAVGPAKSSARRGTAGPPPKASTPGSPDRLDAMADAWAQNGVEPGQKDRAAVEQRMAQRGLEPGLKPTVKDRDLSRQLKQIEPMVDKLEGFIKDNNLTKAGEGGMFSPGAWYERSKTEKAWKEYSAGLPPSDKKLGQLIKYAAAVKIMGAAPWMQIGRGRYIYSEVVQHLPEPTDTPAQLYEKVQFYRNILEDAKASLPSSLQGGGTAKKSADQEAAEYLKAH